MIAKLKQFVNNIPIFMELIKNIKQGFEWSAYDGLEVSGFIFSVAGFGYPGLRYLKEFETSLNANDRESNADSREYQGSDLRPFACNPREFAVRLVLLIFYFSGIVTGQKNYLVACEQPSVPTIRQDQRVRNNGR